MSEGALKNLQRGNDSTGSAYTAKYKNNVFGLNMGYDIQRVHGMKAKLNIDGDDVEGSAYIQKVTVQAPSVPWFWGCYILTMGHISTGSCLTYHPHLQ